MKQTFIFSQKSSLDGVRELIFYCIATVNDGMNDNEPKRLVEPHCRLPVTMTLPVRYLTA